MARLQCPRCGTLVEEQAGVTPVCPNCGFSAGAPTSSAPAAAPPPPSPYSSVPYGGTGSPTPPGYGAQPYAPGAPPGASGSMYSATGQPPKTNALAITSFVLALVGLCVSWFSFGILSIIALILGMIGLNQCKSRNEGGAGLAIAGIVISGISLALGIIFLLFLSLFPLGPWWMDW